MSGHKLLHCKKNVKRRATHCVLPLLIAAMLTGCAYVLGEEAPPAEGDSDYPSLAEVPERPDLEALREDAEGLRADTQNANYNEAPLADSTAAGAVPPPPAPVSVSDVPTPPAAESTEITMVAEVSNTPTPSVGVAVPTASAPSSVATPPPPSGDSAPVAPVQTAALPQVTALPPETPTYPPPPTVTPVMPTNIPANAPTNVTAPPLPQTPQMTAPQLQSPPPTSNSSVTVYPIEGPSAYAAAARLPATVIYFADNSSNISQSELMKIFQAAQAGSARNAYIRVVGHASMGNPGARSSSASKANLEISWARANAVADALMQVGVPAEKMMVTAVADSQPIYQESVPDGAAGNRRVEIYLE